MSDDELDREWKPTARPQSTMARSFSLALNDLFKIDNSLADLDAAVSEKKRAVSSQTSELEALEARLKATEERLKARQAGGIPAPVGRSSSGRSSPRQPRTPLGDTFASSPTKAENPTSPLSADQQTSRPPTTNIPQTGKGQARPISRKQEAQSSYSALPMSGALPPTPGASEGEYGSDSEYVLVEVAKNSADDGVQDGDIPPPPAPKSEN